MKISSSIVILEEKRIITMKQLAFCYSFRVRQEFQKMFSNLAHNIVIYFYYCQRNINSFILDAWIYNIYHYGQAVNFGNGTKIMVMWGMEISDIVKSEEKKQDTFKYWPLTKKIYIFCPIFMKLCENNYLLR